MGIIGNLLSIPLSRRLNRRYAVVAAMFRGLSGLTLVLLAFQSAVLPAVLLFWLVYLSGSTGMSPHSVLFNEEASKEQRSTLLSLESLLRYLGFFAGSVLLGFIAEVASIPMAWMIAGGVMTASLLAYLPIDSARAVKPASSHAQSAETSESDQSAAEPRHYRPHTRRQ